MQRFFQYLNLFPMPLWLAMMLAPNHPVTERASRSSTILGLAALNYLAAIGISVRQGSDPVKPLDWGTLAGVQRLLGSPEGAAAGWAHMLALDLFTGTWIFRECRRLGTPTWVRLPALFFTLMTGPFGLLLFLLWRATATDD